MHACMPKAQGLLAEEETLEQKILRQENQPPLTDVEKSAFQAATIAGGAWHYDGHDHGLPGIFPPSCTKVCENTIFEPGML